MLNTWMASNYFGLCLGGWLSDMLWYNLLYSNWIRPCWDMSGLHFLVLPVISLRQLFFTSPHQTLLRNAPAAEDSEYDTSAIISPLNDWDGLQLLGVVQSQPLIPTWAWLVNLLLAVWHMFIVDQSFSHSGYPKKPGHVSGSKYETVASSAVFEWLLLTVETASMGTQQKPNRRCWRFPLVIG